VRIHRPGFSLIELTIVVLIVSILAAVGAPRYLSALANSRADAVARRILADLHMARRRAQQTSKNQTVVFYVPENRYEVVGSKSLDRANDVYGYQLGKDDSHATLVSADFGGSSTLTFDIYGQPSNAGTIVVNVGGANQTITVDGSGRVDAPTRAEIAALTAAP
jgi:prepilin-type N-terminal cleavage/methylation domain-containing protein